MKKVLFLYTEIAGYTLACINAFCKMHPDVEVHLVRWPVNSEAPFDFSFSNKLKVYDRKSFDADGLHTIVDEINPSVILCSGWIDKQYIAICKEWKKSIPVVLVMDNKWLGTAKQQLLKVTAALYVRKCFNRAWVTGNSQRKFALKLGFAPDKIKTGFYSADVLFFQEIGKKLLKEKESKFPHRFIYVGRYYDFKGVNELWEAFARFKEKDNSDWELWCLGTGDVHPAQHPSIKHLGFIQPDKLEDVMRECGVFILPSIVEPWGVVVHEFVAAGFPLLLSDAVGAAETFLENGVNGFSFMSGRSDEIENAFEKIVACTDEQLLEMGKNSFLKSDFISPDKWAEILFTVIP